MSELPAWISRGKTIAQLIRELSAFEDQSPEVRISVDASETGRPISRVEKRGDTAGLVFCGDRSDPSMRRS